MKAPFVYFGGKAKVAKVVWGALGDVDNYVEPFAGSLAVLLARPQSHAKGMETANDTDHHISNFFRSLQAEPDAVARYADWPVSECDLTARHIWLVNEGRERIANLETDPDAYDAKVAGWWVWGMACWIGGGWCRGNGPWTVKDGQLVKGADGLGVNRQRVHLSNPGQGVKRQFVHLGNPGHGVNRQRVHLCPCGVKRTAIAEIETSDNELFPRNVGLYTYLRELAARLARVRVCCGDWQRVLTPGALAHGTTVGMFLDPPYAEETGRDMGCYNQDSPSLSADVQRWCIENGDNPRYRIALCGYEGEHDMPATWRVYAWKAGMSYTSARGDLTGNRHKERIWFSPHCLQPQPRLM